MRYAPISLPRLETVSIDVHVLLFSAAVALAGRTDILGAPGAAHCGAAGASKKACALPRPASARRDATSSCTTCWPVRKWHCAPCC